MQSVLLLASVLIVGMVAGGSLPFKDCGSMHGKVSSITLDPPPVGACTFPRGKTVMAIVELEMDEVTKTLNVSCHGEVVVWVPFPLPNQNACTQGVTCPTTSGSSYTFKTAIPIKEEFPPIQLVVKLEFKDDNGDDAICVEFPGRIC